MRIETERLILRPWTESDAEALYRVAKDPQIGPIAGWPPHKDREDSLRVIREVLQGSECYAVCLKEDGIPIGCIELRPGGETDMTDSEDECELGYWIGREFWGRGLIPEAAEAVIRRAFVQLGMTSVWCGYYEGNAKSKRVQEKLGFAPHHVCDETPVPALNEVRVGYANLLTREAWLARERNSGNA